ncbi:MAG: hypothetical protein HFI50_11970 [Lachnospiraceae bacterium]|nr:hypothetical protein [Lachnospiraceae bacterium]
MCKRKRQISYDQKDCYEEEIKMQMDVWSVIVIVIVVVGFFGGIWYEHR